MKIFYGRKRGKQILDMLEERVINGERLSVDGLMEELYGDIKMGSTYFLARQKVQGILRWSLKTRLRKKGLPYCALNEKNEYGIPENQAEARFNLTVLYKKAKGMQNSAVRSQKYFVENKLLPRATNETLSLPTSR